MWKECLFIALLSHGGPPSLEILGNSEPSPLLVVWMAFPSRGIYLTHLWNAWRGPGIPLERLSLAISPIFSLLHDFEQRLIFSGASVYSTPKWGSRLCLPQRHCFESHIKKKKCTRMLGLKHQESSRSPHYWYHVSISGLDQASHHPSSSDAVSWMLVMILDTVILWEHPVYGSSREGSGDACALGCPQEKAELGVPGRNRRSGPFTSLAAQCRSLSSHIWASGPLTLHCPVGGSCHLSGQARKPGRRQCFPWRCHCFPVLLSQGYQWPPHLHGQLSP